MKITQTLEVVLAVHRWTEGAGTIRSIERLLGDRMHALEYMLHETGLAAPSGTATTEYPAQVIIDAVILYLAMRHG